MIMTCELQETKERDLLHQITCPSYLNWKLIIIFFEIKFEILVSLMILSEWNIEETITTYMTRNILNIIHQWQEREKVTGYSYTLTSTKENERRVYDARRTYHNKGWPENFHNTVQ